MRQLIQEDLKKEGIFCKCIRCREVRGGLYDAKVELLVDERETLGGKELFLSFDSAQDKLFSMLRLRLPDRGEKILFKELGDSAIVREVHTYGQVKELKNSKTQELKTEKEQEKSQHRGLGKRLLIKAEEIALERGYKKMAIISAIGTREYYRKLGYELVGEYMVKTLA
jgi:elongator complex protein 3